MMDVEQSLCVAFLNVHSFVVKQSICNSLVSMFFLRLFVGKMLFLLRGPEAILFLSRNTCRDSIAKLFRACFCGVSRNYRAIRCKMGYRTDVPV